MFKLTKFKICILGLIIGIIYLNFIFLGAEKFYDLFLDNYYLYFIFITGKILIKNLF
jgi:hypothetical protein